MKQFYYQLTILSLLISGCQKQLDINEITASNYLERIEKEISIILKEKGAYNSDDKFKAEFVDSINGKANLNKNGFDLFIKARMEAQEIHSYLNKYWNYLNHIKHKDHVYATYFNIAGYDDLNYSVFKFKDDVWKNQERIIYEVKNPISQPIVLDESKFRECGYTMIIFNYDEGPKNHENIKLSVKKELLVFERGNLMHSLYDLKAEKLLINEINPWNKAKKLTPTGKVDQDILNNWIKTNLHQKIEDKLNINDSK